MLIGMFSYQDNVGRLERIEEALKNPHIDSDTRAELEQSKCELQVWFRDLERIEG